MIDRSRPILMAIVGAGGAPAAGQAVRGGTRQSRALAQLGKPARRIGDRMQDAHGFVEDADAAILSHREILASRIVRR